MVRNYDWYAVAKGRRIGVYATWAECHAQVNGYSGACHKGFKDPGAYQAAVNFVRQVNPHWRVPFQPAQGYAYEQPCGAPLYAHSHTTIEHDSNSDHSDDDHPLAPGMNIASNLDPAPPDSGNSHIYHQVTQAPIQSESGPSSLDPSVQDVGTLTHNLQQMNMTGPYTSTANRQSDLQSASRANVGRGTPQSANHGTSSEASSIVSGLEIDVDNLADAFVKISTLVGQADTESDPRIVALKDSIRQQAQVLDVDLTAVLGGLIGELGN